MEAVLDHVATYLGKDNPDDLKELNLYRDGQVSCCLTLNIRVKSLTSLALIVIITFIFL